MARWHFKMLNDGKRNSAFKKAIIRWIEEGKADVMDIGSGTGLLSMYAANADGVDSIYAVECNPTMAAISSEVFKLNSNGSMVQLLKKHSMDLKVGEDIPQKVSLIVSETLDSGAFGEGILETMIHAKQHLLEPDGKIVPWKVKIHVAGYKSKSLGTSQILMNETFYEYFFIGKYRLVGKRDEPYDAEHVDKITDFSLVTESEETLEVNFNDLKSMQEHLDGTTVKEFQLQSNVSNDYLDGFVAWFTLYLNEKTVENVITTEPKSGSCWNQAVFKLRERILLQRHQILKLSISCKNGVLKIIHDIDCKADKIDFEVDNNVLRFLNDENYLQELEFAVTEYKNEIVNMMDLSPFPYAGLLLLKDGRIKKLWSWKTNKDLVKMIASKNLIPESSLMFIDDVDPNLKEKFQVIIVHPFHALGDLDDRQICEFKKFQTLLDDKGLVIPSKITLYGELINSDWLLDSCRVTNDEVRELEIATFINQYATEVHLDIDSSLDCERLASAFKISEIYFDDELHENKRVEVRMRNINLPIHAILLYYRIELIKNSRQIATNSKSKTSHFKQSCQVLTKEKQVEGMNAIFSFLQNYGIFKI